jgi:hypothetical protein
VSTDRRPRAHETHVGVERRLEPPWWRVLLEPTIPVIALAEIAHVARRNVIDIVLFAGIAVVIVVDRLRPLPRARADDASIVTDRLLRARAEVLAVCLGYGLLVAPLARAGRALPVVLAVPGVVALVALWRSQPPTHDVMRVPKPAGGWVLWPVAILAALLFELANFLSQPNAQTSNPDHPVLSDVVEPLLSSGVVRGVVCGLWLAVGIWLVRRMRSVNEARG